MDNNTKDPAIWRPRRGVLPRPRARQVRPRRTRGRATRRARATWRCASTPTPAPRSSAMVDADDIVKPYYLRETVAYFSDERIGFVQTFEGNRDYEGSAYYTACVDSYQGFYLAVMSSRNERDTVPFVGTMGLFRRSALEGVGGWNEWCISEDTEASLRVLKAGWSGLYIPRCFGRGIVPPTFAGLNTQRHRWCFGAHADPAPPLAQPDALGPLARQPPDGRPAPRLPHGVAGVVPRPHDAGLRAAAARRHRPAAVGLRLRADAARRATRRCCRCRSSSSPRSA